MDNVSLAAIPTAREAIAAMRITVLVPALSLLPCAALASNLSLYPKCGQDGLSPCPEAPPPPKLKPFSQQAWLHAPRAGGNSSRDGMDGPDLTGWPRKKVIASLGEPGMSEEDIVPGREYVLRYDTYRVSAKNDVRVFVEYDDHDMVVGSSFPHNYYAIYNTERGCTCDTCDPRAAEAEMSKIEAFTADSQKRQTIRQAEAVFGRGHLHSAVSLIGGRYWTGYSETWRVIGQPNMYFLMNGHSPTSDLRGKDIRDAEFYGGYSLIEYWPDCLPPR